METTAYRLYKTSRAFDVEPATSDPNAMPYNLARADRSDLSPHDPIPLFLSDPNGTIDPLEFTPRRVRSRAGLATRIVASTLAAAAIAVVAALFYSDVSSPIAVSARTWMSSMTANPSAAPPAPIAQQIPLKDPARASDTVQLASAEGGNAGLPAMPSREAIAAAYQSALQAQTPPQQVAFTPPSEPTPPVKTLDAETLAGLMTRAKSLMTVGDIAAARLLLERAAHAQDATAAFVLAQTYDPAVLGAYDLRSISADPAAARSWYQQAATLGSAEARQRLMQIQN